MASNPPR
jgi:hypothetical protein